MTTLLDILADTVFPEEARRAVDEFLRDSGARQIPVTSRQIHGLREIALRQPTMVGSFAAHQRKRATEQTEQQFWKLIEDLCGSTKRRWSLAIEADRHLPAELRADAIPDKASLKTPEQRSARNELLNKSKKLRNEWMRTHAPIFFQRFCTHCFWLRVELDEGAASGV